MDLTFDPAKDAANIAKHGISLSAAADLDWSNALIMIDDREDYSEERLKALVPMAGRLYVIVYVLRDGSVRPISLRKANNREMKIYDET